VNVTELPTPTGLGLTAGLEGTGLGQPDPEQTKLKPDVFGPILLTKASLAPDKLVCSAVTGGTLGSEAVGKFPEAVSPAI
jgi:hypothetical protein